MTNLSCAGCGRELISVNKPHDDKDHFILSKYSWIENLIIGEDGVQILMTKWEGSAHEKEKQK